MKRQKGKLYIGTSGWVYSHWQRIFYPEDLPSKDKLKYFSKHFQTVEINYSFYHLPKPSTYQNWYSQTPKDFLFAVKASRFITHIKRLHGIRQSTKKFLENAKHLKKKLGPILFQLPPSFKENSRRLARLAKLLPLKYRYAFEFRHQSWFTPRVYAILEKNNWALVIADSPRYPKNIVSTADFVYLRFHGSKRLFGSKYTNKELKDWAKIIKKFMEQRKDVYAYFNNDAYGYAIENAKELLELCPVEKFRK